MAHPHCLCPWQVEADLPALRQQLAALSSSMSGAGGPESPWAQDAARRLVNRTVLPAVLQKQVGGPADLLLYAR